MTMSKCFALLLALLLMMTDLALATCKGSFVNPITDVEWSLVYPIRLFGQIISPSGPEPSTIIRSPMCSCKDGATTRVGFVAGFWEPARMIDVVKDAWCMPGLGLSFKDSSPWGGGGSQTSHEGGSRAGGQTDEYYAHVHLYIYPVWALLELLADYTCAEKGTFDIAYMSEFDPLWDDDMLSLIIQPEAILFANPAAQAACMADSSAAAVGWPLNPLFWCMGSWGSAYPLTGRSANQNSARVEASANVAGKMIYKLHREMIMMGTEGEAALCGPYFAPVWRKSQYKLQSTRPIKGSQGILMGRTGLIWGANKNKTGSGGDNFNYLIFRNRDCCSF